MKLIGSVQEGLERIDAFVGNAEAFELAVPETLLDPPAGTSTSAEISPATWPPASIP